MAEKAVIHSDPADSLAEQRAGAGIVVLSSSMQLLHMNKQAADLSKQINMAENNGGPPRAAQGVLPAILTELCLEIIKALQVRTEAKDWEQFRSNELLVMPITLSSYEDLDYRIKVGFNMPDL